MIAFIGELSDISDNFLIKMPILRVLRDLFVIALNNAKLGTFYGDQKLKVES